MADQALMDKIAAQRAVIEAALANPNPADVKDQDCDFNPIGAVKGYDDVACDKFGRFWAWNAETKKLTMVYDPRDAGA